MAKFFLLKIQEIVQFSCERARDPYLLKSRLALLLSTFCDGPVSDSKLHLAKHKGGTVTLCLDYAANLRNSFQPCNNVALFFALFLFLAENSHMAQKGILKKIIGVR